MREQPGRPLISTLIDAVGQRSLLVLLDNCEHVLDAASVASFSHLNFRATND